MRITLRVTAGPHKGQEFTFEKHDTFIVGRSKRAHFRLPTKDRCFSRIHFLVEVNPPQCRLMDMGSRNGTFINDQRVTAADLHDGDKIRAGKTILRVAVSESAPAAPPVSESNPLQQPAQDAHATLLPTKVQRVTTPTELQSSSPLLESPGRAYPPRGVCRICELAVEVKDPPSAFARGQSNHWPLCPTCQEQIRAQPQLVAGYHIIRELGRGGMGVVYLALRNADGALIALKTIIPSVAGEPNEVARFLREANILRGLEHPNIVAFGESGEDAGRIYFAMEYVRGTDAAQLVKKHGPLPIGRAVGLICQVLEALDYAHAKQFVHRDIKPANLLITEQEGRDLVKLADFGLARVYQASTLSGLTLKGEVGGTPAFMAPEQVTSFREAKPPADQYAVAATLYYLLTIQFVHDFPPQLPAQLLLILEEEAVPIRVRRPELPVDLAKIIHRCLAREPGDRYGDVRSVRKALAPFCST